MTGIERALRSGKAGLIGGGTLGERGYAQRQGDE